MSEQSLIHLLSSAPGLESHTTRPIGQSGPEYAGRWPLDRICQAIQEVTRPSCARPELDASRKRTVGWELDGRAMFSEGT